MYTAMTFWIANANYNVFINTIFAILSSLRTCSLYQPNITLLIKTNIHALLVVLYRCFVGYLSRVDVRQTLIQDMIPFVSQFSNTVCCQSNVVSLSATFCGDWKCDSIMTSTLLSAVWRVTEAPLGENIAQHGDGSSRRRVDGTWRVPC